MEEPKNYLYANKTMNKPAQFVRRNREAFPNKIQFVLSAQTVPFMWT